MAHRESVQNGEVKTFLDGESFFWNVSSPVGYTCRNKKEDVMLVQFLINKAFGGIREEYKGAYDLKVPANLVIDGDFGGKTWAAIKYMQAAGHQCVVDGAVGSPDGTRLRTPKQRMVYTIYELNSWFRFYNAPAYKDIRMDKDCPSALTNHLYGPLPDLV